MHQVIVFIALYQIGLGTVSMRYAFAAQTVPAAGTFPLRELFSDPGEIDGRKLR
jgi:hypothetical protein